MASGCKCDKGCRKSKEVGLCRLMCISSLHLPTKDASFTCLCVGCCLCAPRKITRTLQTSGREVPAPWCLKALGHGNLRLATFFGMKPQNTIVLIMGTPQKGTANFGKLVLCGLRRAGCRSSSWLSEVAAPGPPCGHVSSVLRPLELADSAT